MGRARRISFFAPLLLAACESSTQVTIPDDSLPSWILVAESDAGIEAFAGDRSVTRIDLVTPEDSVLTLLSYMLPLERLGLSTGRLRADASAPAQRGLPLWDQIRRGEDRDGTIRWSSIDRPSSAIENFRFPDLPPAVCAEAGGCYDDILDVLGRQACVRPCPAEITVAAPDAALPPAPPQFPVLTPCYDGWSERIIGEGIPVVCEPPERAFDESCAFDHASFVDTSTCTRLGSACPNGPFADGLQDNGSVLFVDPSVAIEGDGTRIAPFRTINAAVERVRSGGTNEVALAKGRYGEQVRINNVDVRLRGACVLETLIDGGSLANAFEVSTGTLTIENLAVQTTDTAVFIGHDGRVRARGVRLHGSYALQLQGGQLSASELRISGTEHSTTLAGPGSRVQIDRLHIDSGSHDAFRAGIGDGGPPPVIRLSNVSVFVRALPGAPSVVQGFSIHDADFFLDHALIKGHYNLGMYFAHGHSTVRDVELSPAFRADDALVAGVYTAGADLDVKGLFIDGVSAAAIVLDEGPARFEDVVIRRSGSRAAGIVDQQGGAATFDRMFIEDSGLFVGRAGSTATISDYVSVDTRGGRESGVAVRDAVGLLRRAWAVGDLAVFACDENSKCTVEDLTLRSHVASDYPALRLNKSEDFRGVRIDVAHAGAVAIVGIDARVHLEDLRVSLPADVDFVASATRGAGLQSTNGVLTGARWLLEGGGLRLEGTEGDISDMRAVPASSWPAEDDGLLVRNAVDLALRRIEVANHSLRGVWLDDSSVAIDHLRVSDVGGAGLRSEDASVRGSQWAFENVGSTALETVLASIVAVGDVDINGVLPENDDSFGVAVATEANLVMARFRIRNARTAGVLLESPYTITLESGEFVDNGASICLEESERFVFASMLRRVRYRDEVTARPK